MLGFLIVFLFSNWKIVITLSEAQLFITERA